MSRKLAIVVALGIPAALIVAAAYVAHGWQGVAVVVGASSLFVLWVWGILEAFA